MGVDQPDVAQARVGLILTTGFGRCHCAYRLSTRCRVHRDGGERVRKFSIRSTEWHDQTGPEFSHPKSAELSVCVEKWWPRIEKLAVIHADLIYA